jgi:hypothetical protein
MRTHTKKLSAIGTAIGLVLMASAVSPAVAASSGRMVPTAATYSTCASYKNLTVVGSSVSAYAMPLKAGDTINTTVSPASSAHEIYFMNNGSLSAVAAPSGHTFRAPTTGVYYLSWSLETGGNPPSTITWKFTATCSTTTVSPSPAPVPTATTKPGKGGGKGR